MAPQERVGQKLRPGLRREADVESVAAHYDKGDRLIQLFIDDRTKMYTCALWLPGVGDLADAQVAKVDYTLGKLDLKPGQRLWDVGFGYGFTLKRAREEFGVIGVGATLSEKQLEYAKQQAERDAGLDYRFQGWEELDPNERFDAIVSIGAFEQFGSPQYPKFFETASRTLPKDGKILLHTIVLDRNAFNNLSREDKKKFIEYGKFIVTDIFPHGQLPRSEQIREESAKAGFELVHEESLQDLSICNNEPNYALTLERWAENLERVREQAIGLTDQETYDRYMKYLTQSAQWFREGVIDVRQFLLRKQG